MDWKELSNWGDLPEGSWIVKTNDERHPYHVAYVSSKTGDGHKMINVGNHFYFDMGEIIAYSPFDGYKSQQ